MKSRGLLIVLVFIGSAVDLAAQALFLSPSYHPSAAMSSLPGLPGRESSQPPREGRRSPPGSVLKGDTVIISGVQISPSDLLIYLSRPDTLWKVCYCVTKTTRGALKFTGVVLRLIQIEYRLQICVQNSRGVSRSEISWMVCLTRLTRRPSL